MNSDGFCDLEKDFFLFNIGRIKDLILMTDDSLQHEYVEFMLMNKFDIEITSLRDDKDEG